METTCSVVLPVWNRAPIVSKSIESILRQTYKNYELIIVDDGSQDDLERVVQSYRSERVHYYKTEHKGVSAARNFGIERASGEYIAYIDSDNQWHSIYLEKMLDALAKNYPASAAAYCKARCLRINKQTGETIPIKTLGDEFNYRRLLIENYIDMNTFVHSRDLIEAAGNFDLSLHRLEDWDLILRIVTYCEPVYIEEVLVDYYLNLASNRISDINELQAASKTIIDNQSRWLRNITLTHNEHEYGFRVVSDRAGVK
jgi:glycosyltransferase involved in cell wall biosynthesis